MKKITLKKCPMVYKNNVGQQAQVTFIFNFTDKIVKADNIPHTVAADFNGIQIKSYHATVSRGTYDIDEYLKNDKATEFAYVTKDFKTAYIMSKIEYKILVDRFTEKDICSTDGSPKLRLKRENKKMMSFLEYMSE